MKFNKVERVSMPHGLNRSTAYKRCPINHFTGICRLLFVSYNSWLFASFSVIMEGFSQDRFASECIRVVVRVYAFCLSLFNVANCKGACQNLRSYHMLNLLLLVVTHVMIVRCEWRITNIGYFVG